MWTRRGFLGLGALGAAACCLSSRSPAREQRRLVVLQLTGGNDGLNTLVPYTDERYRRLRPELGLRADEVLRLDAEQGLHPALRELRRAYDEGLLACVNGVGHALSNLSHFRSQAIWDAASEAGSTSADGWLGRHYEVSLRGDPAADSPIALLALGRDTLPLGLKSRRHTWPAIPNLARWSAPALGLDHGSGAGIQAGTPAAEVRECLRSAQQASALFALAANRRPAVEYAPEPLARALKSTADVIAADLPTSCFYLSLDGFDTHSRQRIEQERQLAQLDRALGSFLADLRALRQLDLVLVLVISEFGRRAAQSGIGSDAGTDHGRAGLVLLLGGRVRAGLHGAQPDLADLDADGNVKSTLDFRRVYAGVIDHWLGGDSRRVLAGAYEPLEILRG
jgi:uncharacterized protein (DUF1501 family)